MNTLATAAVAALLDSLYAAAAITTAEFRKRAAISTAAERAAFGTRDADYKTFYGNAKDAHLAVSRETGTLLYLLARGMRARHIVEFGTSFGVSTIHLASASRDNGGGRIVSSEFEPSKVARARENIATAGLADLVEIREGDALETLSRDLPEPVDLVLLDGAKGLYPQILSLIEPRLRPGAMLVADNANWSADYLARVRGPGYVSVPFGGDVELSTFVGNG